MIRLGDTFRPVRFDDHLWVVITEPALDPVVIVNLTTYTPDEEDACILNVGDHPFIKHQTAARYWEAKCVRATDLERLVRTDQLTLHQPCSEQLLKKLWRGAALSRFIKLDVLQLLERRGVLPD